MFKIHSPREIVLCRVFLPSNQVLRNTQDVPTSPKTEDKLISHVVEHNSTPRIQVLCSSEPHGWNFSALQRANNASPSRSRAQGVGLGGAKRLFYLRPRWLLLSHFLLSLKFSLLSTSYNHFYDRITNYHKFGILKQQTCDISVSMGQESKAVTASFLQDLKTAVDVCHGSYSI